MSNLNKAIIELLNQELTEQSQLLAELKKLGYLISQSNLSRKLKNLGIKKNNGVYQLDRVLKNLRRNLAIQLIKPNLVVVKCEPGCASALAAKIDQDLINNPKFPQFVGSIAGDDTIFVAVIILKANDEELVVELLKQLLE